LCLKLFVVVAAQVEVVGFLILLQDQDGVTLVLVLVLPRDIKSAQLGPFTKAADVLVLVLVVVVVDNELFNNSSSNNDNKMEFECKHNGDHLRGVV
jgi:hypothetical protein